MLKLSVFIGFLAASIVSGCSKKQPSSSASADWSGTWVLEKVFMGDVYDSPCGNETSEQPSITLSIKPDTRFTGKIVGKSAVNQYFTQYSVSEEGGKEALIISDIGATRMAGPEALMACEQRYFEMLKSAVTYQITGKGKDTRLLVGRIKTDDTPSRDGGSYLLFKRSESTTAEQ